jgi:hypothetical protein
MPELINYGLLTVSEKMFFDPTTRCIRRMALHAVIQNNICSYGMQMSNPRVYSLTSKNTCIMFDLQIVWRIFDNAQHFNGCFYLVVSVWSPWLW